MDNSSKTLIVLTGPTASGKSALSVRLAQKLGTEIISADSRQIYRGIPIATAVTPIEERGEVPHHLLEVLGLESYYSSSMFEQEALGILDKIFADNPYAIVCGGSMMYLDALCNGTDDLPTVSDRVRADLTGQWHERGDLWLLESLREKDPEYYDRVDRCNLKRVFHALEISIEAGVPYSSLLTGTRSTRGFRIVKFCLDGSRQQLFGRINRRVDMMVDQGLEQEAARVYPQRHLNSLNTVGLKELFAHMDGLMDRETAIARIKKNTRVYAKKQLTWHKRDSQLVYLDFEDPYESNVEKIVRACSRQ